MRIIVVACACLLTACSTQPVRCERHLTPINVPKRLIGKIHAPRRAQDPSASAKIGATEVQGTSRPKANGESAHPKPSTSASGGEGTP